MKKHYWIFLTITFIFGTIVFAEEYNFRNTKWGMTQDEVKRTETLKISTATKDKLKYNLVMYQWKTNLNYYFGANGVLNSAEYNFFNHIPAIINANALDQMGVALYHSLQSDLIQKYGQPQEDNTIWTNESFKSLPENLGAHIAQGHLILLTLWETNRTIVALSCKRDYQFLHPYANSKISYYEKSYYQSLQQLRTNPDTKNL
jgi:hypothetical protein